MQRLTTIFAVLTLLLTTVTTHAEESDWLIAAGDSLEVGVLSVDASELADRYNDPFTSMLRANLKLSGVIVPLPEGVIERALSNRGLSLPRRGFGNPQIGGEVGSLVGVEYILVTRVSQNAANYDLSLKLVKTATDEVVESATISNISPLAIDFEPALAEVVVQLVNKISEPILPEMFVEGPLPGMMFARIESGVFIMGSERGDKEERPVRKVNVEPFELMTTEVTQRMWMELLDENPSKFEGDARPVEKVTLREIKRFIVAMNLKDPDHFYRLPTEAEWEYAARCGKETQFPFGDDSVGLDFFCWFKENSDKQTHQVGTREPNAWGLYDMLGNVFEYCVDSWYKNYEDAPLTAAARLDRRDRDGDRVIRGGSYKSSAWHCRPAARLAHNPNRREEYVGFRLARSEK